MKIDPNKVAGLYETNYNKNVQKNSAQIGKDEKLTSRDRVEISRNGARYNEIADVKSKIISEIDKGANADKIQRLKDQIANGTYSVSSSDIAAAMLNKK